MTLTEIKQAVENGQKVYWSNENYEVIKDKIGQWLIVSAFNGYTIGLTWQDNVTMNGKEEDFFVGENEEEEYRFHIDKKVSVWIRETHYVKAKTLQIAQEKLIEDFNEGEGEYFFEQEYLYDTEEDILPHENNNKPTIDITCDKTSETIYVNYIPETINSLT
jgi:hypothetical protein